MLWSTKTGGRGVFKKKKNGLAKGKKKKLLHVATYGVFGNCFFGGFFVVLLWWWKGSRRRPAFELYPKDRASPVR